MSVDDKAAALPAAVSIVVPGELTLGPAPNEALLAQLAEHGVTAVLSLQETGEARAPSAAVRRRLRWVRVPLADGHAGGSMDPALLARAVEQLRAWRADGHLTYLHCYMGIGRAPTVAAAYLAAEHGLALGEALARVRAARPRASPTAQQLLILARYIAALPRNCRAGAGEQNEQGADRRSGAPPPG